MLLRRKIVAMLPTKLLWRLTLLNTVVFVGATAVSGWAIYHTACYLVAGIWQVDVYRQLQFKETLFAYLLFFLTMAAMIGSVMYYYLTKRLLSPINQLIWSTKQLKLGQFPQEMAYSNDDEIGMLVEQYNDLVTLLEKNEIERKKLVSDISHEIRTPLANVSGYLQALKDGHLIGDQTLYSALHLEANRLAQLIEQFEQLKQWDHIALTSMESREWVSIIPLVEQCVRMFEWSLKEKQMHVVTRIEKRELYVHAEGMQQVLSNMIDNAIRYYEESHRHPITIIGRTERDHYLLIVTGPGQPINDIDRTRIFDRFYRVEQSRSRQTGGTGLGLAITKEIVQQHGGSVGVKSEGTVHSFWVKIPLK